MQINSNGRIESLKSNSVDKEVMVSFIRPYYPSYLENFGRGIESRKISLGNEEPIFGKKELRKEAKALDDLAL